MSGAFSGVSSSCVQREGFRNLDLAAKKFRSSCETDVGSPTGSVGEIRQRLRR